MCLIKAKWSAAKAHVVGIVSKRQHGKSLLTPREGKRAAVRIVRKIFWAVKRGPGSESAGCRAEDLAPLVGAEDGHDGCGLCWLAGLAGCGMTCICCYMDE